MKHRLKIYAIIIAALYAFITVGCSDPVNSHGRAKTGLRITVSSKGSRTLYPTADFTKYVLSFSGPGSHEDITLEKEQNSITVGNLASGTWTITAVGWVEIDGDEYPAAQGSVQATVVSGVLNPITITLHAKQDGAPGFFSYSVDFPSAVTSEAVLYIYPFGVSESAARGNGSLRECNLQETNAGVLSLPAGYYLMHIRLHNSDSPDKTAGRTELVHIYSNMETEAQYAFSESDFTVTMTAVGTTLAAQLQWLKANAHSNAKYILTAAEDESIEPHALSWPGIDNIAVELAAVEGEKVIDLSSNGSMFTVGSGVTLVLGGGITLHGKSDNTAALVKVEGGGALVMRTGGKISGNTASYYYTYGGGVYVSGTNATFTMEGGEISGNTASGNTGGGGVNVSHGTFTMNGGEISGNTGGGVSVSGTNATFTMNGGEISGNTGGGVSVRGGTFTMEGGEISGNTASSSAGGGVSVNGAYVNNVYVSGTFTMNGGEISGNNTFYSGGGGVYVNGGTFTMSGGEISGNTVSVSGNLASSYGGGVYVGSGTFTMNSGEISGNTASAYYSYGGGMYVGSGTFTMTGGTITGYASDAVNGNVVKNSSGTVVNNRGHTVYVDGGTARYGDGSSILPHTDDHSVYTNYTITGTGTGTGIVLSGSGTEQNPWLVSNASEWNRARALIIGTTGNYFIRITGNFSIESDSPTFGNTPDSSTLAVTISGDRTISLATGSTGNLLSIARNQTVVMQDVDLKGHGTNTTSLISVNGNFTMQGNASVSGNTSSSGGGGVYVNGGTFTMSGGEISGNTVSAYNSYGGGVYVSGGTFTMTGGEISGNTSSSSSSSSSYGGGVYVNGGTFTMSGGTISGNTASSSDSGGGGVYSAGTFTMSGGTISGNTVLSSNSSFYGGGGVSGTFTMNGGTITGYASDTMNGNVVKNSSGTVVNDRGHAVYGSGARYGDGSRILPHTDGHSNYTNYTITGTGTGIVLSGSGTEQNPWLVSNASEWNRARALIIGTTGNYFIRITGNFNMTGSNSNTFGDTLTGSTLAVTISGDRTISLAAGSTGNLLRVDYNNQTVVMQDVDLRGHTNNNNSLVNVRGGSFTMQGNASVSGNTSSSGVGCGVYVSSGTFTMSGGTISGNTSSSSYSVGGGVVVSSNATFTMNGGEISGNTASGSDYSSGGGVYVSSGTFTMSGGTISGNTASSGGGVYVSGTNVTFTMSGGTISGNTSSGGGGVLVNNNATFTMSGGTISGNTAISGGGVYVNGTFTMTSGEISGNTTTNSPSVGGGVVVSSNATFTMSGGTISGNTSSGGGGVFVNGTFTMNGGEISGNTTTSNGGGMYVEGGAFTKTGGTIYGYSASDTVNSNVVKNSSGTVVNDRGHAVYAYINSSTAKRKETTAGPGVNLSFNSSNGTFSGNWDY